MNLFDSLRHAVRLLIKDRSFTVAAICALALGIAANAFVFTIVNGRLFREPPFAAAERIVALRTATAQSAADVTGGLSYVEFLDWQSGARTFDDIAVFREATMNVSDDRAPAERVRGAAVSANAWALIGVRPSIGRDFRAEDDRPSATPTVMLSHALWQSRYGGEPTVVGRTVRINGAIATVVGVMPELFAFPSRALAWQPAGTLSASTLSNRAARDFEAIGRLKVGVTIDQARADLDAVAAGIAARHPDTNIGVSPRVMPFRERTLNGRVRAQFRALMAAVGFVLLIACANVANLLLARAAPRAREVALRLSLGAGRARIVRQLLVESLVLAVVSGVAGIGLAAGGLRLYLNSSMAGAPYWMDFSMDWRVVLFLTLVSLGTAVLFGLVPALYTAKAGLGAILNEASRGSTASPGSRRWSGAFVVAQLALTLVLLTGAGLAVRDLVAQYRLDAGVDTSALVLARLSLPAPVYPEVERRAAFYRQINERIGSLPGVQVTYASAWPRGGSAAGPRDVSIAGRASFGAAAGLTATNIHIGPRYFDTLDAGPVRGRDFTATDRAGVAIVNERFAARFFPGVDPVGRQVRLEAAPPIAATEWLTIVGVAPDIRQHKTVDRGFDPVVYVPYASVSLPFAMVLARPAPGTSAAAAMRLLRETVRTVDAELPLFDVMPLDEKLAQDHGEVRELSALLGTFGAIALLLAAVGLYGVTAFGAAQRTREIGVRVALGARSRHIWWVVTRRALAQVAAGLALGVGAAAGAGRVLQGFLEQTPWNDLVTLIGVPSLLTLTALAACYVPSRRALRLDPVAALRN